MKLVQCDMKSDKDSVGWVRSVEDEMVSSTRQFPGLPVSD